MHYYQFHIGDYRRDTMHLSFIEHGIYRQLLDSYYLNDGPFKKTPDEIMRLLRVRSKEEKQAFRRVFEEFFEELDGVYFNKKCDEVIAKAMGKSIQSSNAAKSRWSKEDANALPTHSERNAIHHPSPTIQDPVIKTDDAKASLSGRVPDCPHQAIVDLWHETLPECPTIVKWTDTRARLLKGRWREVCVDRDLKTTEEGLEFFRKLFTYIKSSPFLMGKTVSRDGRPFECELEWVINPNNFVKIIEGKYHAQKTR